MTVFNKDKLLKLFKENGVSEHNQEIAIDYLESIQRIGRSKSTVGNNVDFIKWLVLNFNIDLDKLTRRDVNKIQDKINVMCRVKDGKPVSPNTKQLYKISLKRFLKKFGREIENQDMVRLADFEMKVDKPPRLKPDDMLSEEELNVILSKCESLRDKVVIALMAEVGARVGEISHCKLNDAEPCPYGFYVLLRGKTGERRVVVYKSQQLLRQWLAAHPDHDNPNAPLFPTTRRYSENSYKVGELRTAEPVPRRHNALTENQIGLILRNAVKRSGIEKRVYPHLLRHSAATQFANHLTEQQMKVQFGWTATSPMPGRYSHIQEADVQNKILSTYGVQTVKDMNGIEVKKCPRCSKPITVGLLYCECGMPLTEAGVQNYNKLLSNDQFMLAMMKLNEELNQMIDNPDTSKPEKDSTDW